MKFLNLYPLPILSKYFEKIITGKAIEFPIAIEKRLIEMDYGRFELLMKSGEGLAKNKDLIIGALMHNVGTRASASMQRFFKIGRFFRSYKVAVYENNSTDTLTKQYLELYKSNPNCNIISENNSTGPAITGRKPTSQALHDQTRFIKMAMFRNQLKKQIYDLSQNHYESTEDLLVLICDGDLSLGISPRGILQCLNYDFDAIFPYTYENCIWLHYYDTLAYESSEGYRILGNCPKSLAPLFKKSYLRKIKGIHLVNSAFGGAGLYKWNAFSSSNYNEDGKDCEHIDFHSSMRLAGYNKLFINRNFIGVR
ncbi:MAG: hypothetical protein WCR55_10500 [Lentisphaerota bacterium]